MAGGRTLVPALIGELEKLGKEQGIANVPKASPPPPPSHTHTNNTHTHST